MKKNVRIAACAMTAVLAFGGLGIDVNASESVSTVLPSAGIDFSLQDQEKSKALSSLQEESDKAAAANTEADGVSVGSVQVGGFADMASTDNKVSAAHSRKIEDTVVVSEGYTRDLKENTGLTEEEEGFKNLVIARVNDYVNVRDLPSEEGNIVGKLYNKSVGNFIEEENGWYKIKSGSVEGYVKGEYCVTGDAAVDYAKEVGTRIATVTTTTLKVREQPGLEETVLGLVPIEDELIVTEELDGWVKVNIEEGDGYVSNEYVTLSTEFVKAESIEEERARLEKEEAARKAAQEAANKKMSSKSSSSTTTDGADCSGFVMSVYNNFGVSLPHSSAADRNVGATVNGIENAQPGDIVCYSGHVGIYAGNGQLVHASTSKTGIIVSSATYRPILSIRRIF